LGLASFIIALFVAGLEVLLALATAITASRFRSGSVNRRDAEHGLSVVLDFACLSVPVGLIGVVLAVAALVAYRDRKHVFTWIGLIINGLAILPVIGVMLFGFLGMLAK
jgi:hypothetical protein